LTSGRLQILSLKSPPPTYSTRISACAHFYTTETKSLLNQYNCAYLRCPIQAHILTPCSDNPAVREIDYYDNAIAVLKTQKR